MDHKYVLEGMFIPQLSTNEGGRVFKRLGVLTGDLLKFNQVARNNLLQRIGEAPFGTFINHLQFTTVVFVYILDKDQYACPFEQSSSAAISVQSQVILVLITTLQKEGDGFL